MLGIQNILPSYALYNMSAHSSSQSWLAYISSSNELRLIQFNANLSIKISLTANISNEPVKSIRLIYNRQDEQIYLSVTLLTKFLLFKRENKIFEYALKLNKNIVEFSESFASCEAVDDGKQVYFVFATVDGEMHILPVLAIEKHKVIERSIDLNRISSMSIIHGVAIISNQVGVAYKFDMNLNKILKTYDTKTKLPIYHTKTIDRSLILATVTGELHLMNQQLEARRVISAHFSMITELHIKGQSLFTFADDGILRSFAYNNKSGQLQINGSKMYQKKVNMIFTVHGKTFVNFYEQTAVIEIDSSV